MIAGLRNGSDVVLRRGDVGRDVGEVESKDGDEKTFKDKRCNNGGFV